MTAPRSGAVIWVRLSCSLYRPHRAYRRSTIGSDSFAVRWSCAGHCTNYRRLESILGSYFPRIWLLPGSSTCRSRKSEDDFRAQTTQHFLTVCLWEMSDWCFRAAIWTSYGIVGWQKRNSPSITDRLLIGRCKPFPYGRLRLSPKAQLCQIPQTLRLKRPCLVTVRDHHHLSLIDVIHASVVRLATIIAQWLP